MLVVVAFGGVWLWLNHHTVLGDPMLEWLTQTPSPGHTVHPGPGR